MRLENSLDNFVLKNVRGGFVNLLDLPIIKYPDRQKMETKKIIAQGLFNGKTHTPPFIPDCWDLRISSHGKPRFLLRTRGGQWMELRNPAPEYLETMKVVMVAAYFLTIAKQKSNGADVWRGDVWRYIWEECSGFEVKPDAEDLEKSSQLIRSIVLNDVELQHSCILAEFFPALSYKKIQQEVPQNQNPPELENVHTRNVLPVNQGRLRVSEPVEPKLVYNPPSVRVTPPEGGVTPLAPSEFSLEHTWLVLLNSMRQATLGPPPADYPARIAPVTSPEAPGSSNQPPIAPVTPPEAPESSSQTPIAPTTPPEDPESSSVKEANKNPIAAVTLPEGEASSPHGRKDERLGRSSLSMRELLVATAFAREATLAEDSSAVPSRLKPTPDSATPAPRPLDLLVEVSEREHLGVSGSGDKGKGIAVEDRVVVHGEVEDRGGEVGAVEGSAVRDKGKGIAVDYREVEDRVGEVRAVESSAVRDKGEGIPVEDRVVEDRGVENPVEEVREAEGSAVRDKGKGIAVEDRAVNYREVEDRVGEVRAVESSAVRDKGEGIPVEDRVVEDRGVENFVGEVREAEGSAVRDKGKGLIFEDHAVEDRPAQATAVGDKGEGVAVEDRAADRSAAEGFVDPYPDWVDEPDVCTFCDDGVGVNDHLLCCDVCMRSFHTSTESGKESKCYSLNLSQNVTEIKDWVCPNCAAAQHQCFACGELGNSDPNSPLQAVFECGVKKCKRFYHADCVVKLLFPLEGKKREASDIQQKKSTFTCPLHRCAKCKKLDEKPKPYLSLLKCRRCPRAWHKRCLPKWDHQKRLWALEDNNYVLYCGKHKIDKDFSTPMRDHILFPIPPLAVHESGRENQEPSGSREQASGSRVQASDSKEPAPGSKEPAPGSKEPAPGSKVPAPGSKEPASRSRVPTRDSPGAEQPRVQGFMADAWNTMTSETDRKRKRAFSQSTSPQNVENISQAQAKKKQRKYSAPPDSEEDE